jgi:lysophospholipase L1-like esterase
VDASGIRMLVFGDSVTWGQGLLPEQKFHSIVAAHLEIPVAKVRSLAHSGAVIGRFNQEASLAICHGEVPVSLPSVLQQVDSITGDTSQAEVVLLNGGSNDVDPMFILNPLTSLRRLKERTDRFCGEDMEFLIGKVRAKFPNPRTRIVVTSYYPYLSRDSRLERIDDFLNLRGVSLRAMDDLFAILGTRGTGFLDGFRQQIADQCVFFWKESSRALREAVSRSNSPSILFAEASYTERNAALASDAWIWGPLEADPVKDERSAACRECLDHPLKLALCLRASAGHPNVKGAQAFAKAILEVLRR